VALGLLERALQKALAPQLEQVKQLVLEPQQARLKPLEREQRELASLRW
jgi:hypothetical protein